MSGWSRHPADTARLVVALLVLVTGLAVAAALPDDVLGVSGDIARLAEHVPDAVQQGLLGLVQVLALVTPLVLIALAFYWRRPAQVAVALGAGAVAAGLGALLQKVFDDATPASAAAGLDFDSWITGAAFPSASYLAAVAATTTVLAPSFSRRWRRTIWIWIGILAFARVLTAVAFPLQLVTLLALGVAVGSLALVAFGSPARRFDLDAIPAALATAGLSVEGLRVDDEAKGLSHRLRGSVDGEGVVVQVVGRDERDAELLLRAVRVIRVKGIDDDLPGWTPTRVVEHEALCTLLASNAGVRVPAVMATAETEQDDGVLVLEAPAGPRLSELSDADLSDEVLADCWRQLATLHRRGIAHRRPNLRHFRLATDGRVHLGGFRLAQIGAEPRLLASDVAELLVDQASRVGVDRALSAALAEAASDDLSSALPLVQPLAVSSEARAGIKERADKALWDDTRTALQERLQLDAYELEKIQRVSIGSAVGLLGGVFLVYVALSFASNWEEIREALRDLNWWYLIPMIVMSVAGYAFGAVSLMGASPLRLPFPETFEINYAQSYLNKFIPANAGGMALRTRYLQKHGLDLTLAAAAIGLTSAASGVMQVVLIVGFALWAGSTGELDFSAPDVSILAVVIVVVGVAAGVLYLVPAGRRMIKKLLASLRHAAGELIGLARDPIKMIQLFGGGGMAKVTTIVAWYLSVRAFGIDDISFATLGFGYMTANTIASTVPTPGGVGAIEAALFAVLTGLEVEAGFAWSIVLIFRLVTYWGTIPPSWFFLGRVRRAGLV